MKKFFKFVGLSLAGILGLIAVAALIALITGTFNPKKITITKISWEESKVRTVDSFYATINFSPENATEREVELSYVFENNEGIIKFPKKVTAGVPFLIEVVKNNDINVGGEVVLKAQTSLVVTDPNLTILVDIPIPNDGLIMLSDFDSEDEQNIINAGSSSFGVYVFTDPSLALSPTTGLTTNVFDNLYKDIALKVINPSDTPDALHILNQGEAKEGFYCPDYIEHGHKSPFLDTATCAEGSDKILQRIKYIKYEARATASSKSPVIVTAQSLRTFSMQADYVDISDEKYLSAGASEPDEQGRRAFFNDLSDFVEKYKSYIIADNREYVHESGNEKYVKGQEFINKVTDDTSGKVKINDNELQYNAALFYIFVECKKIFNIEEIEVKAINTSLSQNQKVTYDLHSTTLQYSINDLKETFGLSLVPSNEDEFDADDLNYRMRELKVMAIMNKAPESGSLYDFDYCNYVFDIENPTSLAQPIWKIKSINPIKQSDLSRQVRLRFYLPKGDSAEYKTGDPYQDIEIDVMVKSINEFKLLTEGNNALQTTMILNSKSIYGQGKSQILNNTRYILKGANNTTPTYTMVKFFVTSDTAKTKNSSEDFPYYKVKFNNGDEAVQLRTLVEEGGTIIEAYEIAYKIGDDVYLEALNVTAGEGLKIIAAVIKTDHNGNPVDSNGVPYGHADFNGDYSIVASSENYIEIDINYYLESLNFYTYNVLSDSNYEYRNIATSGSGEIDTVQLLAGETYSIKASAYKLDSSGGFSGTEYSNKEVDYKTNLKWAMDNAFHTNKYISFLTTSTSEIASLTPESYDSTTGTITINFHAKIKEGANSDYNPIPFDFKAEASGENPLKFSFENNSSKVQMIVNYAKINEFDVSASTDKDKNKDYYVLSPQILEVTDEGGNNIAWRDISEPLSSFDIHYEYVFDIEDSESFKLDKSYALKENYVEDYVKKITDYRNTGFYKMEWSAQFENTNGGSDWAAKPGNANIDDYITITTQEYVEEGVTLQRSVFNIKKGEVGGIYIRLSCTIKFYSSGATYIVLETDFIDLVLKQGEIKYEFYSPKIKDTENILIENKADDDAFIMIGGGSYNLLLDYGSEHEPRTVYKRNDVSGYEVVKDGNDNDKTSYNLINVILGDDGRLAGFCTYTIDNVDTGSVVYFLDKDNNATNTARPQRKTKTVGGINVTYFELILYADYIDADKSTTITVTAPFGDVSAKFHIYVQSSIILNRPADNTTTSITSTNYGKINLSDIFTARKDGTKLKTSFEIISNNPYADISGTETIKLYDGSPETLKTILTPYNVFDDKIITIKMHYYMEQTIDGETRYVKTSVDKINVIPLSIIVKPGYEITVNDALYGEFTTTLETNSGESLDLFDTYYSNPENFIKIKNNTTQSFVVGEALKILLKQLITLSYHADLISDADELMVFNSLFTGNQKEQISNGVVDTQSIAYTLRVPLQIKFKEGSSENFSEADTGSTIYIVINAFVMFEIKSYNAEAITYDDAPINEIFDTQVGHLYYNINIDSDKNSVIELGEYTLVLFEQGKADNLLSLKGGDGRELLHSKYLNTSIYKLDISSSTYKPDNTETKVKITEEKSGDDLSKLTLNILNAVNEITYFKLSISTSINDGNDTFDYYFTVMPKYMLKINYPLEEGPEKIRAGRTVNLTENYINDKKRIEIFSNETSNDDKIEQYYYTIDEGTGTTYTISTTNEDYNKSFTLPSDNISYPISYSVVSGAATVNEEGIVTFGTNPNERVNVKVTLFNGAYINYYFDLYQTLSSPVITVTENVSVYADNEVNILKYLNVNSTPSDFKYIVKYITTDVEAWQNKVIDDKNKILTYTDTEKIAVTFADVGAETTVKFYVWHNNNVDGDAYKVLNIKLLPNLQITENEEIKQLVAGTTFDLITQTGTSWLKVLNDDYESINCSVSYEYGDTTYYANNPSYPGENPLGIVIDRDDKTYTFKSKNVGIKIPLSFVISRDSGLSYFYEFTINLVPNIKLNSGYTEEYYHLTAAAGNGVKAYNLNNEGNNLFKPQNFNGEDFTGNLTANLCDINGELLDLSVVESVSGLALSSNGLTLTLKPVNNIAFVYIKITATWDDMVDSNNPYTTIIRIQVNPNIITLAKDSVNGYKVEYSSGSVDKLDVYAGSTIELNFDNALTTSQLGFSANVKALQNAAGGSKVSANVVIRAIDHENYKIYASEDQYYIMFYGTITAVNVPIYFDLTGEDRGVKGGEFNFESLYNPNISINFSIVASISGFAYKSDTSYDTSENPFVFDNKLKNIYINDGENADWSSETDPVTKYINDHSNVIATGYEVNEFNIVDLFNFTPKGDDVTFTIGETDKIYINLESVYASFDYVATVKFKSTTGSWGGEVEYPNRYVFINATAGKVYIIPPASADSNNVMEIKITISIPGVSQSQTVYLQFQYASIYGNGGEIIGKYALSENGFASGTTIKLNDYFKFGYWLKTVPTTNGSSENGEEINTNKNIIKVTRISSETGNIFYYYLLNNVPITYAFESPNYEQYATIDTDKNELNLHEYYTTSGENEEIKLVVMVGSFSQTYTIPIKLINVEHLFNYNEVGGEMITKLKEGENVLNVAENEVTLNQGSLTADEYVLFNSWLLYNDADKTYSFKPDKYSIQKEYTLTFVNKLKVDNGEVFEKELELTITPYISLSFNKQQDGITASLTENTDFTIIGKVDSGAIFITSYDFEDTISDMTITLTETDSNTTYSDYISYSSGKVDKVISVTSSSNLTLKSKKYLQDITLPFTLTMSFSVDDKQYTLQEEVNIKINANVGLSNLKEQYTISMIGNVAELTDTILNNPNQVEKIGSGTISLWIKEAPSVSNVELIEELETLNNYFKFTIAYDEGGSKLKSITINIADLVSKYLAIKVNSIKLAFIYEANEETFEVAESTINFN